MLRALNVKQNSATEESKMLTHDDIPHFTRTANYHIDVSIAYFKETFDNYFTEYHLDLDPDFQRAHVWDEAKQVKFIEYLLRGGMSGLDLYFNCPEWGNCDDPHLVCVDGKQRITAILRFLNNEYPIFGKHYAKDCDRSCFRMLGVKIHINNLQTRAEVLNWYLDLNDGGVAHTSKEIQKVRDLLEKENP
jgi:hypothetical protein